ncbi:MAG TPA: YbjN domain-containing protein [Longimicrobiales bacterium]
MATRDDLESYLIRLGVETEEIEDGLWVLRSADGPAVVIQSSPPVLVLRLKVLSLPEGADTARLLALYRKLLELNATDLVHGSYGIEEDDVVLTDAMELATLDFEELRSSYESLIFAASSHLPGLAELILVAHEG